MHSTKKEPSLRLSEADDLHPKIYETVWLQVDEKPCMTKLRYEEFS
jgi:hypothetical protein